MTPRVRRTFWMLVVVAVVSTGALSNALEADPGAGAGLAVVGSALLLTVSALPALRILLVIGRRTHTGEPPRRR